MTSREYPVAGFVELAELGAGAQGKVVLARHESGGGPVAIKYLAVDLLGNTEARNTFRTEAEMLKRVVNPHVARLLDYLESPWGAAIVLEAVAGRPLRKVLDEHDGPLTPEAALTTLKGSLLGLAAAHAVGVVHRDYKPANVLVQDDGQSKLIDFGVAVLTGQGGRAGTPVYMAPEQWAGEPATPATDLYAATCVFMECVSGNKPFQGTTLEALKNGHTQTPPPLELVPDPLRPLIERGMAKSPADRFWNAHEFVSELEAIAVQSYGPDWERRGLLTLGAVAAAVATTIPLAALGGALLAPGASSTAAGAVTSGMTAPGSMVYAQGTATADFMAKTGTSASKGFMAKVGGTKGAAAIGGVGVGAVIAAWVLWPSGPGVGGESRGGIHAYFTRPGVLTGQPNMPASETPYMDLIMTVTPARVKPGTDLRLVQQFRARTPAGAKYLPGGRRQCFGEDTKRTDVVGNYGFGWYDTEAPSDGTYLAFYRVPPAKPKQLPTGPGAVFIPAKSKKSGDAQPYIEAECAFRSKWTQSSTLKVPGPDVLAPGTYLVSMIAPLQITGKREGVSQEAMGTVNEGSAPIVEVLDG
ncbi:serine/threonine-protein kinase [Spirillospora sp. NPDC048824]|uniref:serine/threonine-protein kinase n=1 Tax=Spirillospora sp. NPDC048824 TaxID=3364526 RepID=UPI0037146200